MTTEQTPVVLCYIAIKPDCGCATGIVVDDGLYPKDVARCVGDFIKSGRTIERVTLEDGKARVGRCQHKGQGALL